MTTELKWTRNGAFVDRERDVTVYSPGVYDVPDAAVDEYLDHSIGGWTKPDEADGAADTADSGAQPPADTGEGETTSDESDDTETDSAPADDTGADDLTELTGVAEATADALQSDGFETFDHIRAATVSELSDVEYVTDATAADIKDQLTGED